SSRTPARPRARAAPASSTPSCCTDPRCHAATIPRAAGGYRAASRFSRNVHVAVAGNVAGGAARANAGVSHAASCLLWGAAMKTGFDWAAAVQDSPIGIAVVDPGGQWLEVNPALTRLLGYNREELLTLRYQAILHPEDLGRSWFDARRSGALARH